MSFGAENKPAIQKFADRLKIIVILAFIGESEITKQCEKNTKKRISSGNSIIAEISGKCRPPIAKSFFAGKILCVKSLCLSNFTNHPTGTRY
jgi:hypothetical protein